MRLENGPPVVWFSCDCKPFLSHLSIQLEPSRRSEIRTAQIKTSADLPRRSYNCTFCFFVFVFFFTVYIKTTFARNKKSSDHYIRTWGRLILKAPHKYCFLGVNTKTWAAPHGIVGCGAYVGGTSYYEMLVHMACDWR